MRSISVKGRRAAGQANLIPPPIPVGPISIVVGVMMLRAWTTFGLQAFIPLWYASLGYKASFYGLLATTLVLANAVGAIGAGTLADRVGRRVLIVTSTVLSVPAIFLFASFTGPIAFLFAALIGLLGASTTPLLLVTAQQLMVGRAGMASGLILGLGFVMGAVGVPILGAVGDAAGIQNAMRLLAFIAAVAAGLAALLPSEAAVRTFASRESVPAPEPPGSSSPNPA
jgi:FSR family fosmidomycin resistance protein-like MFS transporter